jgi:hypothetical protein
LGLPSTLTGIRCAQSTRIWRRDCCAWYKYPPPNNASSTETKLSCPACTPAMVRIFSVCWENNNVLVSTNRKENRFLGYLPTGSNYLHIGEQSPGSMDANRGYHLDTHSTQPPTARGSAYKTVPTILQQSLTLTIEDLRQHIRLVPIQSTVYRVHMDAAQFSLAYMPSET